MQNTIGIKKSTIAKTALLIRQRLDVSIRKI